MAMALLWVRDDTRVTECLFIVFTDLNIPICGVAGLIMILFLRLRTPPGTLKEKLRRIDWV